MDDKKRPTATDGSTDAVTPKDSAVFTGTGEDVNSISENTDGDGQHKMKKEVNEASAQEKSARLKYRSA